MLKLIVEPLSGAVKKLPGFPLVLGLVTAFYLNAFGTIEANWQEAIILVVTWLGYRWGRYLDKPIYDSIFGPRRKRLPILRQWQNKLDTQRDRVAARVFPRISDYAAAVDAGMISDSGPGTLYNRCASLLKHTRAWEERIAVPLALSKSARAFVILLPLIAVALAWFGQAELAAAKLRLGVLGAWQFHAAAALVALLVFVAMRYIHHTRLYAEVAQRVSHVQLADGRSKAEVVEAELVVGWTIAA
jgi:hypothetical protein